MAQIAISHEEIVRLGDALDALTLTPAQKALLTAVVTVAADVMSASDPVAIVDVAEPVPSFHDQFAASFTPETVDDVGGATGLTVGRTRKIGRDAQP